MSDALRDIPFLDSEGNSHTLADYDGQAVLVVNVASRCGLTPQYEQLEELQRRYGDQGFTVLGFPCNQFMGQEPGSMEEILDYCATTWGVSFPIFEKIKVNGRHQHPLYRELKKSKDSVGLGGVVAWNFEKFLIAPDGAITRFRPPTKPDAPEVISAIEAALPSA